MVLMSDISKNVCWKTQPKVTEVVWNLQLYDFEFSTKKLKSKMYTFHSTMYHTMNGHRLDLLKIITLSYFENGCDVTA